MRVISVDFLSEENGKIKTNLIAGPYNVQKHTPIINSKSNATITLGNAIVVDIGEKCYCIPKTLVAEYLRANKVIKEIPDEFLLSSWSKYASAYNAQMDNLVRIDRNFDENPADSKLVAKIKEFINTSRLDVDPMNMQYINSVLTEISRGTLSEKKAAKFLQTFNAEYDVVIYRRMAVV